MHRMLLVFGFLFLFSGAAWGQERIAEGRGMFREISATVLVYRKPSIQAAMDFVREEGLFLHRDRAWRVLALDTTVDGLNHASIVVGARQAVLGTSAAVPGEITSVFWFTRFGSIVVVATYQGNDTFFGFMAERR